ncbi:hypothetical protein PP175_25265 (plasmid) [Aneurinibacillus sp. Ricciae_BoGa-3]|uniref:hypothetical protein n=1 Tax=Aneurinibacillus sp. Ricciae_BoGa-3 TaxID=3022697 RepID=UPI00234222EC|nr:hypothetical protein [Aneurinibacillus sp. Ricciae_BoGa-3]WCK57379.1 hypothetical protein PP175_25265 [Aneurinibacillus sp. Ricciae_BoGa-3]
METVYVNESHEQELAELYPLQDSLDSGELSRDEYEKQFASKLEAIAKQYNIDMDCCSVWIEKNNDLYCLGYETC